MMQTRPNQAQVLNLSCTPNKHESLIMFILFGFLNMTTTSCRLFRHELKTCRTKRKKSTRIINMSNK
jgi:hypothetical protein